MRELFGAASCLRPVFEAAVGAVAGGGTDGSELALVARNAEGEVLFGASDARKVLLLYIETRNLTAPDDPGSVVLDPLLSVALLDQKAAKQHRRQQQQLKGKKEVRFADETYPRRLLKKTLALPLPCCNPAAIARAPPTRVLGTTVDLSQPPTSSPKTR